MLIWSTLFNWRSYLWEINLSIHRQVEWDLNFKRHLNIGLFSLVFEWSDQLCDPKCLNTGLELLACNSWVGVSSQVTTQHIQNPETIKNLTFFYLYSDGNIQNGLSFKYQTIRQPYYFWPLEIRQFKCELVVSPK